MARVLTGSSSPVDGGAHRNRIGGTGRCARPAAGPHFVGRLGRRPDELRRSAEAALSPDATLAVARGGDPAGSVLWFSRGDDLFRVRDGGLARVPNVADELLGLTEQPGA
ncbi:hypothetical protein G7085_12495 [Tessaracoccus sp. HDW20]|uniref:hypothetical protein n=1 Tax=Tessaracoccus coleopterorum TaxID=2714950 RepID=UPI0018D328E3|nr:hypothetical protein [Tessaracoccus coleopterorum]NHB85164.1 hypothetical protein [Tessaracoccus coleopterorum]